MKLNKISLLSLLVVATGIGLGLSFAGLKDSETLGSSTAWVDGDDPTCGGNSPCFQTIQAAVEAVDDSGPRGGFVYIRPGRYRENVVIKRTVSLIGVGGSVRLEAADPTRPTILISNGLQSRSIETIHNLEVAGGKAGIDIVDARVGSLIENRITSLTNLWPSFAPPSVASHRMEVGIWVERAVIWELGGGIRNNEISNATAGIVIGQGAAVEDIYLNTIQRTGIGIELRDQVYATWIANNTFKHNGNHIHIRVTGRVGQGGTYIVNNQMLLAELHGIAVEAEGARLTIENNLIADSGMTGIYLSCQSPSFSSPVGVGEKDPCPGQQGPDFIIIRNHIVGGRYGIILVTGQGKILRNQISENGFTTSFLKGAGLLLGQKMRVEISHNWIVNNILGAGYSILAAYNPDCQFLERPPFEGKLTGSNNEIRDNEFSDLCPPDYPWPPGFRK